MKRQVSTIGFFQNSRSVFIDSCSAIDKNAKRFGFFLRFNDCYYEIPLGFSQFSCIGYWFKNLHFYV